MGWTHESRPHRDGGGGVMLVGDLFIASALALLLAGFALVAWVRRRLPPQ